ncbi:MAG: dihydrodipicolinate synthase family protein [Kiritimatiellae bacterium]|nr:dihydrodipicolinate synthase family protein [Kiritimatiellia bacterium]
MSELSMNRRSFLKTAAVASVGTMAAGAAKAAPRSGARLPLPPGRIFEGLDGAWAAMYTPFVRDTRIDAPVNYDFIPTMVEYYVAKGLTGLYLTGSTGEGFLLSHDERVRLYKTVVAAAKGRLKLIAHIGCFSTADAVKLAKAAADAGVDWVSSVAPVYFGQSFKAAYDHYKHVSEATNLPFLVYSVGKKLVPDEAFELMKLRNVHGMKYTGRDYFDFGVMCRKLEAIGKPAVYFAGADEQVLNAYATGRFSGCIGTTDNMIGSQFVNICRLAASNDFAAAAKFQERACRYVHVHLTAGNSSLSKSGMRYIGLDCGYSRRPAGIPYTEAEYEAYCARLEALGSDVICRDDAKLLGIV